jgi:hypothetical protein
VYIIVLCSSINTTTFFSLYVWPVPDLTIGISPALLEAGDMICILSRGATPFVLPRDLRSSPSKRRFQLVGEAYVHGIMHAEAIGQYPNVAFDIVSILER